MMKTVLRIGGYPRDPTKKRRISQGRLAGTGTSSPLLYDVGMASSAKKQVIRQYDPPYGYLKRSYEVMIIVLLMLCGAMAGYIYLDGYFRALGGAVVGYWFARGLFWVLYYFVEGKKRPWQFGLRATFFVMTLMAVLLAILMLLLNEKP